MALSLDSIYKPLNDFFLQKFGDDNDAAVAFRFAHLPQTFSDNDFLLSQQPWPDLANERFSMVVDAVPRLDDDGRTVWLSIMSPRLSDLYGDEILGPAIPFVPADVTDDTERQARIDAFNSAKADASRDWATIQETASLLDPAVSFRSSTATPANWWDKNAPGVWTSWSFQVKGAATVPGQPGQPAQSSDRLLRMRVDDSVVKSVVTPFVAPAAPPSPPPGPAAGVRPMFAARAAFFRGGPILQRQVGVNKGAFAVATQGDSIPPIKSFPFKLRQEIILKLAENAPTQPVTITDVTISFDYCMVSVRRAWLHNAFINNQSWRIPGLTKGQLSANDGHGLPALPVGFVAIKALKIQAPWTPEDITNLEQSVQFGPFNFDSQVVNGAIGHEGIQIIGWLLQPLSDLPPNDPSTLQGTSPSPANQPTPTPPSDNIGATTEDKGATPEQPQT
jgi:hypothetical protein